jgi:predicted ATPase
LRQLVAQQMERLPPADQRMLAAASVAGVTFSAGAVAAAVPMDMEKAEGRFARLAQRQQFVRPAGFSIWPDGTETARYAFRHAVYQELWHEHVLPPQRPTFHRRIGQRLEAAYGARATEVAAELAVHFEEGREYHRAVQYHAQAAQTAIRRQASHEAIGHLRKALDLLQALPDTPERTEQEFGLQFSLRVQLGRLQGEAAPALEGIVARIRTLSEQVAPTPAHFWALASVYLFYLARQELPTARRLAEQHLHMAQGFADPLFAMAAQTELGIVNFFLGEFAAARTHFDHALARYDTRASLPFSVDWEHGSPCLSYTALTLWQLGYPEQAGQKSQEALGRAQGLGLPYMQAFALNLAVLLYYFRGERDAVQEQAATAMHLATTHGFAGMVEMGKIFGGWVLAHGGEKIHGIVQLQHGMRAYHATGGETFRPSYLALLAEACKEVGKIEDGLGAIDEALAVVHRTGGRYCEAQLYRLRGDLLLSLATPNPGLAEACFQQALATARGQQAKAWELQVAVSLSRLWQRQGKTAEARRVLAEIYYWFTEGFATKDLQEAKALLAELA